MARKHDLRVLTQKTDQKAKTDTWNTSPYQLEPVRELFSTIDLDPCSNGKSRVGALLALTKRDDGLRTRWGDLRLAPDDRRVATAFVNPPYDDLPAWVAKARAEWLVSQIESVMLIPGRVSNVEFHAHCYPPSAAICFVKGRQTFLRAANVAPFPVVYVLFGRAETFERFREIFSRVGVCWIP